jgi:uncharacterized YigZ family protein
VTPPGEPYLAPAGTAHAELREKGSRFLAMVEPVEDEPAARERLKSLSNEYSDSTHVCWAWRIGQPPNERCSDAGEPAGTAGTPMLQVLRGAKLSDVLAVVVRWYGGVKLGKGGLARAYSQAVHETLEELPTVEHVPTVLVEIAVSYTRFGELKRLVHPPEVEIVDERYADESVRLTLKVAVSRQEWLREALASLGAEPTFPGG